jgi:peptidyl-prolyl cis-trans isomerase SurA
MQKKIVEEVEITLRKFVIFSNQYQKRIYGAEMEVAQIVITPKVSDVEKQVIDNGFKEVEEGSSFATKAVLYSKDPGSSSNGGIIK